MKVKIEQIATAVIPGINTTFVNIYGMSSGQGVFIWDAKDGVWIPYIDKAPAANSKNSVAYKKKGSNAN